MKTYIITGASSGLGEALGKLCAENGIKVVCLSRSAPKSYGADHIPVDLTNQISIEQAAAKVKSDYPKFDALINCAGMLSVQSPNDIKFDNLSKTITLNVLAPIYLTSQLFDQIKENEADIVNVGSTVGTKAYENQCAYGASKWGIRGVSQNLQLEFKGTPTRVIQFNPGGFQSELFQKATGKEVDLTSFMDPSDLAKLLYHILDLPKSVEVSEILVNRK